MLKKNDGSFIFMTNDRPIKNKLNAKASKRVRLPNHWAKAPVKKKEFSETVPSTQPDQITVYFTPRLFNIQFNSQKPYSVFFDLSSKYNITQT